MVNSLITKMKLLARWLWLGFMLLIVGMVIFIFLGRQTIGSLDQLRPTIQSFIASNTGMQINLGELKGEWPQLVPIVDIASIEIVDADQSPVLSFQRGRANLDLFNTIKFRTPIWRELAIEELDINLIEDAEGHWHLQGLSGQSETDLNIIVQPFLFSRLIRLKSVSINLKYFSGNMLQVFGENMLIENDADFHRAQLSLSFSKDDIPAYVVLEGHGNPFDVESFYADGYLKFEQLNLSEPVLALTKSLMPELFESLTQSKIKTGGEIWVDIHPGGSLDFEGYLSVSSAPLNWLADIPPISDVKTELTGWYTPGQDWGARLQALKFNWAPTRVEPFDMLITQHLGSSWQEFTISANHLDLASLSKLLREIQIPPTKTLDILDKMRPSGNLSSFSLGKNERGYYLSANLDGLNILPYKGIPGIKGVNGYLELHDGGGLFHIADNDGLELYFPKVYRDYLPIDKAQGSIYFDWQSAENALLVRSDPIVTNVEAGESQIMFSIEQPRFSEGRVPEFNLVIGSRGLDLSYGEVFMPYKMPQSLSKWLKTAVVDGYVKEFGLLFRSGPPKKNRLSRTTQLMFNTETTEIKFHPQWSQLEDVNGLFLVDDGTLSSKISSAKLGRAGVNQVTLEYSTSQPIEQRRLIVDASLQGSLADTMDILIHSPIKRKLGPIVDWHYIGQSQTQVHLEIPLVKVGGQLPSGNYNVSALLNNALISIADSPVEIKNITGSIEFSSESGLYSDDLTGTLWQQPLSAKIVKSDNQQKVSFKTVVEPTSLNQFIEFPWSRVISGVIPIEGTLNIDLQYSDRPVTLKLTSLMQGAELTMPEPLGKPLEEPRALNITLYFDPDLRRLEGSLGDSLLTELYFQQAVFQRGMVSYDRLATLPENGNLLVSAYLPTTDLTIWQPLATLITGSNKDTKRLWNTAFDLQFDHLSLAAFDIEAIGAKVTRLEAGIRVALTSSLADGQVIFPSDKYRPPAVDLTRLQLPNLALKSSVAIDPRQFAAIDISVDKFSVGEKAFGSLSFELRPELSGAAFNNISGNLFGLRPGIFEAEAPTEFFWGYDGQVHLSKIVGPVGVDNIGDLFRGLDMQEILDSRSGKLDLDLSWQGEPWSIGKENLRGDFKVSLTDGNFYKSPKGAEATLKAISLFNFANWLRRLQLDFSDVVGQKLAYNSLKGTLSFNQGLFNLNEPLKMLMPSGRMSMAGDFNLVDETVDAQLIATLPVATNLPWLVGLAGGLPAAVGVYVTSKLVEEQVDRLSSISYKLSGSWDDIEVSVNDIFAVELPSTSKQ